MENHHHQVRSRGDEGGVRINGRTVCVGGGMSRGLGVKVIVVTCLCGLILRFLLFGPYLFILPVV